MAKKTFKWRIAWYISFIALITISMIAFVLTMTYFEKQTAIKYILAVYELLICFLSIAFVMLVRKYEKYEKDEK